MFYFISCEFDDGDKLSLCITSKSLMKYMHRDQGSFKTESGKTTYTYTYDDTHDLKTMDFFNKIDHQYIHDNYLYTDLLRMLYMAKRHITDFEISDKTYRVLSDWISGIIEYEKWEMISQKKDLITYIIQKRFWPYFNSFSTEWKNINASVRGEYPENLTGITKKVYNKEDPVDDLGEKTNGTSKPSSSQDSNKKSQVIHVKLPNLLSLLGPKSYFNPAMQKMIISDNTHNYEYIKVTTSEQYHDIDEIVNTLRMFKFLGMDKLCIVYAMSSCINFNSAHIIRNTSFWGIVESCTLPGISKHDYNLLISYFVYYAINIINYEEYLSYNTVIPETTRIYDYLEVFCKMKDFSQMPFENHPYVQIYSSYIYKSKLLPLYLGTQKRKFNTMECFKQRFSWATKGVFDNIDLKLYKAVISGSILIPCVVTNPLEDKFVGTDMFQYLTDMEILELYGLHPVNDHTSFDLFKSASDTRLPQDRLEIVKSRNSLEIERDEFLNYLECYYPSYRSLTDDDRIEMLYANVPWKSVEIYNKIKALDLADTFDWTTWRKNRDKEKDEKIVKTRRTWFYGLFEKDKSRLIAEIGNDLLALLSNKQKTDIIKKPKIKAKVFIHYPKKKKAYLSSDEEESEDREFEESDDSYTKIGNGDYPEFDPNSEPESEDEFVKETEYIDAIYAYNEKLKSLNCDRLWYLINNETILNSKFNKLWQEDKLKVPVSDIKPGFNQLSDVDISIHTNDINEFRRIAYELYEEIRDAALKLNGNPVYIKRKTSKTLFKYYIFGPGLLRDIDLFCVFKSPEVLVKGYHLGIVRMYYDTHVVKIFNSCFMSLLTGINFNYKWLSCNKIPGDIILKYTQRGYSTMLNSNEIKALTKYVKTSERWSGCVSETDIMGLVYDSNPFFYPESFNSGIRLGLRSMAWTKTKFITSFKQLNGCITYIEHLGDIKLVNDRQTSIAVPNKKIITNIINL